MLIESEGRGAMSTVGGGVAARVRLFVSSVDLRLWCCLLSQVSALRVHPPPRDNECARCGAGAVGGCGDNGSGGSVWLYRARISMWRIRCSPVCIPCMFATRRSRWEVGAKKGARVRLGRVEVEGATARAARAFLALFRPLALFRFRIVDRPPSNRRAQTAAGALIE